MEQVTDETRPSWRRAALGSFLELFALAGLAITQPLLGAFGDAPDFFVFRDAGRTELIAFAVLVAVVPALVLWLVEQLLGLAGPRPRRAGHLAFLGLLVALFAMGAAKQADVVTGALLVVLGAAAAVLAVVAYRRWAAVQTWVRILAVAPLLFVGLFLTTSPSAALLESQNVDAAAIAPVAEPHTVVMLQFDEWPLLTLLNTDGQIDPELYPNLAELAGDGVWYRNTTTAATFTTYAVPAILTGRYPHGDRTAIASEYPENLFTLLGGQFDLDVIEAVTRLCPTNLCDGQLVDHPRGAGRPTPGSTTTAPTPAPDVPSSADIVRQLLTDARQTFQAQVSPDPHAAGPTEALSGSLGAPATTTTTTATTATTGPSPQEAAAQAASTPTTTAAIRLPGFSGMGMAGIPLLALNSVDDMVGSIEAGEDPTVHFLHVLLPHSPYKFLPDGRQYDAGGDGLAGIMGNIVGTRSNEQAAVNLDEQRLLLQAAYTDTVIGRVMDRLKAQGLYDDAIIVVAADHGIGLSPGGIIRAAPGVDELPRENYADLLYTPLVIKAPGLGPPGTVSDDNVETIDILPTIADELGIDLPWPVDGIALGRQHRRTSRKETHVVAFAGGTGGPSLTVGPALHFDGDEILPEVLARNIDTVLRDDNPDHRLYDISDAGEIVGERVDDLEVIDDANATTTIDDPGAYDAVDPGSGVLPAHLIGRLDTDGRDAVTVAIALNGRVAAVTPTWTTDDALHHLEAMLDPSAFRSGRNDLQVFVVGGREGARTLAPVALVP